VFSLDIPESVAYNLPCAEIIRHFKILASKLGAGKKQYL